MKKIKIAQIGMNRYSHAPEVFHTLSVCSDEFEIVGYAIVEDERETCADKIARAFAGYRELTLDEILNDPEIEAVTVETDEIHLLKYAQMAADHGKHIHMEKPGSQSVEDFERLVETVRKNGTVLHIGYMYRYNPFVADAVKRARDGELGHIYSVEAHMSRLDSKTTREWFGSFKGGMSLNNGITSYEKDGVSYAIRIENKNARIQSDFSSYNYEKLFSLSITGKPEIVGDYMVLTNKQEGKIAFYRMDGTCLGVLTVNGNPDGAHTSGTKMYIPMGYQGLLIVDTATAFK